MSRPVQLPENAETTRKHLGLAGIKIFLDTLSVHARLEFISLAKHGDSTLEYLPHAVKKCDIPPTPPSEEEQKDEGTGVEEVDVKYLRSLDPKEWKKQDHYKVLGLEKARIRASDEFIKTAYRKMVLKHHPDKRKAQGEEIRKDITV